MSCPLSLSITTTPFRSLQGTSNSEWLVSTGSYTWAARSRWASPPRPSDRCKEQATVSDSYLQVVTHELPALAEHHHHALQIAARNVLFNDALNTFYLRLYGVRHMVKDHSDSEKGNPLPPHRLLLSINSKGSFICTIPQTGYHIPRPLLHQLWSTGWSDK